MQRIELYPSISAVRSVFKKDYFFFVLRKDEIFFCGDDIFEKKFKILLRGLK